MTTSDNKSHSRTTKTTKSMPNSIGITRPDPLAYFLTWPTYGTWLPGDKRGWVHYHRGWQLPNAIKQLEAAARMSEDACRLNKDERAVIEATIAMHCEIRQWTLHATNCRSNHLHVVLTADEHPDEIRNQLKAWCTRRLKEHQQRNSANGAQNAMRRRWWSERGSSRYISDEGSLEAAILYVRDYQDIPH